ncbi:hypothetical protein SVAN01_01120 [Stagonosporopsis vannaccii]|nr:hypothetical protein SVAN01_01120 [Stagonosporopsis vannaccii]
MHEAAGANSETIQTRCFALRKTSCSIASHGQRRAAASSGPLGEGRRNLINGRWLVVECDITADNVSFRRGGTLLTDSSNTEAKDLQHNINTRINSNRSMAPSWHGAQARGDDRDGGAAPYPYCSCDAP